MGKAKNLDRFLDLVVKLEPIEFLGCAKIMGVDLVDEGGDPIPFEKIFADMLYKFTDAHKNFQRDLLKIMRASVKPDKKVDK